MFQFIDLPIELFSIILSFYSQHSIDFFQTCLSLELVSFSFYEKLNKLIWKDLFIKKFIKFKLTDLEEKEINEIMFEKEKENLNYKQCFIQMKKLMNEWTENNKEIKIATFGVPTVGKTTFITKFMKSDEYINYYYSPTIEDSYRNLVTVDKKSVFLDVVDCAGHDEYKPLRELYVQSSDAFLLICSVNDKSSLLGLEEYLELLLQKRKQDEVVFPSVVICVNKVDLPTKEHVITNEIIDNFLNEMITKQILTLKCPVFYTSALQNVQLNESFDELVRRYRFNSIDMFKVIKAVLLNETNLELCYFLRKKTKKEKQKKPCFLM
ncbi:hypothetical protein ABK040_003001 [Willaertia magna]